AGKLEYTQNLQYFNGNAKAKDNPTVQRWPEIDAFKFKDAVPGTPLEFEGSAKYDYFSREAGTTGHRLKLNPSLSLPLASDWVTVIPSAGFNHMLYLGTDQENLGNQTLKNGVTAGNSTNDDSTQARSWFDTDVTAFSEFYRVFQFDPGESLTPTAENVGNSEWIAMKHSVIPRLDYQYSPNFTGQDKYPAYDELDRPLGVNKLTYSLTNVIDRKARTVTLAGKGEDAEPTLSESYLDVFRLRLEQSYDANEATRTVDRDKYRRRPFSDLMAEIVLQPMGGVTLTSKTYYSPYLGAVTEHEHLLRYEREGVGAAWVGYDYQDEIDEYTRSREEPMGILRLGGDVYITHNLLLGLEFRHDMWTGENLEKTIRLTWLNDCWNLGLELSATPTDTSVGFTINLMQF
ncbi:MAG: LPS assembly protein LptD, partial [Desulfovibrionaceae bacterium]